MNTQTVVKISDNLYFTTAVGDVVITDYIDISLPSMEVHDGISYYSFSDVKKILSNADGWDLLQYNDLVSINHCLRGYNLNCVDLCDKNFAPKSNDSFGVSLSATGLINDEGKLLGKDIYSCIWMQPIYGEEYYWYDFLAINPHSCRCDMYHCSPDAKLPLRLCCRLNDNESKE